MHLFNVFLISPLVFFGILCEAVVDPQIANHLTTIWAQLDKIQQEMKSLAEQRRRFEDLTSKYQTSGFRQDHFSNALTEVASRMEMINNQFFDVYSKMNVLENLLITNPTKKRDPDSKVNEILRTVQRIEQNLATTSTSPTSSTPYLGQLQNLLLTSTKQLENNLEFKLQNLVNAQQKLMEDLLTGFSENVDAANARSESISAALDRKLRQYSVCKMTSSAPEVNIHNTSWTSSRLRHGQRRYSTRGFDIVAPPETKTPSLEKQKPAVNAAYWIQKPRDCSEIYLMGYRLNGIYDAFVENDGKTIPIYCDMETNGGGWTVIQRRDDQMKPHENFDRSWKQYKRGFGELEREFWLGNNVIHILTLKDKYMLRFEVVDYSGHTGYAEYEKFQILNEYHNYMLQLGRYIGGSISDEFNSHNNSFFSTPEEDNDKHPGRNCAETFYSGWWFDNCFRVNLNGVHVIPVDSKAIQGLYWGFKFPGNVGLRVRASQMKIRPFWFQAGRG